MNRSFLRSSYEYRYWIVIFVSIIFVNAFVTIYILNEKYIYYWDFTGYWDLYSFLGEKFALSPHQAIKSIVSSIQNDEYNLFPVLFLMPFYYVFGDSRLTYVLATANLYLIPSVLILTFLSEKIVRSYRGKIDGWVFFLSFATIILFWPSWIPLLRGLPDISGIVFLGLALLIYFQKPIEEQKGNYLIALGVLLFLMTISRRWYSFWAFTFLATSFIERTVFLIRNRSFTKKNFITIVKKLAYPFFTYTILMILLIRPILIKSIESDYGYIYSAYKLPLLQSIRDFEKHLGITLISFVLIAIVLASRRKEQGRIALFATLQLILIFYLFNRIQSFGLQHYLLISANIIILLTLFIDEIYSISKKPFFRIAFLSTYTFIFLTSFSLVFIPSTETLFPLSYAFPLVRCYPLKRNDIEEIYRMVNTLENILDKNPSEFIYVLSSSKLFNSSTLSAAARKTNKNSIILKNLKPTADVDRRDGFPFAFFESKYVILADPIQYALPEKDQQVVGILAQKILNKEGIGMDYEKMPFTFNLDNGVKVYIYQRLSPATYGDVRGILNEFLLSYPDWSTKYGVIPSSVLKK